MDKVNTFLPYLISNFSKFANCNYYVRCQVMNTLHPSYQDVMLLNFPLSDKYIKLILLIWLWLISFIWKDSVYYQTFYKGIFKNKSFEK